MCSRTRRVHITGRLSKQVQVKFGVPLGLDLLILYIHDLLCFVSTDHPVQYADDTTTATVQAEPTLIIKPNAFLNVNETSRLNQTRFFGKIVLNKMNN